MAPRLSRREMAKLSAMSVAAGFADGRPSSLSAEQSAAPADRPAALKSEFLLDMILETGGLASGPVGSRNIVAVTGGTFEGPKLKGTVLGPGGDWLTTINPTLRVLDVRTIFLTDDNQRIYVTYRGVIHTPQGGERYWRTTPVFETSSEKYAWLNSIVCVGVPFTVPQRTSYRVFQIL
jgi:uncharacterized protein DUF3237